MSLRHEVIIAGAKAESGQRRFSIAAYDGGPLMVAGFELPVVVDLKGMETPESVPVVTDHDVTTETTLGSTDTINNDGRTLSIGGVVTATFDKPKKVVEQHDAGQKWQASIGVHVIQLEEVSANKVVAVNGQQHRGPMFVARKSLLFHVGVLPAGADHTTQVNLAASAARVLKGMTMNFEEWVASLGLDVGALSEEDTAALSLAYEAKMGQSPEPAPASEEPMAAMPGSEVPEKEEMEMVAASASDTVDSLRKAAATELRRQQELSTIASKHPAILASAIENGWSAEKTENAVLKEEARRQTPSGRGHRTKDLAPQVIEAAVCMARKVPGHEKQYSDEVLQSAHDRFGRRGIGLQQLLLVAAAQNGETLSTGERVNTQSLRRILRAAFATSHHAPIQAAFGSVDLPGILSNVANKELLAGYEIDEKYQLWRQIAEVKSVPDFKTVTSYRMLADFSYEKLGPGGKIKHGSTDEESYTRQAATYAKMFSLTREDIINDDLGAFDDLRKRLGMGAAQKLSDVFWTAFLDNSSFFTSGRGNYISGSTTDLDAADATGLQLGLNAFRTLQSPTADGTKYVGGEPELLLVPTELAHAAERYYVLSNLNNAVAVSDANIHQGKYKPVIVPWLSDSSFTGYSTTAWYLLRSPNIHASMVVSFLDGVEQPTVESADADFDTLGVEFRGYHDFGCDQAEYLAGIKSKGAA